MSEILQKAFDELLSLPESLQNQIALEILEEVEWEKELEKNSSEKNNMLEELAQKAKQEYKEGKTFEMGIDDLLYPI